MGICLACIVNKPVRLEPSEHRGVGRLVIKESREGGSISDHIEPSRPQQ